MLLLLPAAASGGYARESGMNTSGAPVTLTVTLPGSGAGWVTSDPTGISCGTISWTICSAQFPDGALVYLHPTPAAGSTFGGWSVRGGNCGGTILHDPTLLQCFMDDFVGDESVQAMFNRNPPNCTVPRVVGRTVAKAKVLIKQHHCDLGKVTYAFSRKAQRRRVISQSPPAGWQREQGAKIKLVVSKGTR